MLIHFTPQLYCNDRLRCQLIDVTIPEFGLALTNGNEITVGKPYPNKNYLVAYRKEGKKAMQGLLVKADRKPQSFNVLTRWDIGGQYVAQHHVKYILLDQDFDMVTDAMIYWGRFSHDPAVWVDRWPENTPSDACPVNMQPRIDIVSEFDRCGEVTDILHAPTGRILERRETFYMHTIQRQRVIRSDVLANERIPTSEDAFDVIIKR